MLSLKSSTAPWWLETVEQHIDDILLDHAHCEKKAAGTAMNLIFAYVENAALVRELSDIVDEELSHFRMVIDLLESRGHRLRRLTPSSYGRRLNELVRRDEPARAIDRLLIAALIEARSCERFRLLSDHLADAELARFYGDLFESEARHHATYVRLALHFGSEEVIHDRLDALAQEEAAIIDRGDEQPRMHG